MAIHTEQVRDMSAGFEKQIDESAKDLILENLQKSQYQHPVQSTVREIVCNGIDSIADRDAAMDILEGAPVSKYYVEERTDALFRDSKFDPAYYDPKWLSKDKNVYIRYVEGKEMEKNYVVFSDNGTGLGGKRLQGYFSLGYSTKRLSRLPLGKFGIGAKAALSVVPFYTMESRYNGRKYRFNVYSSRVDSIVPQFNLTTGTENPSEVFANGYKVYYESTEELNGVTVTVETKKHHKAQYIQAVRTQLLYFQHIVFTVQNPLGNVETLSYRAGIIYEDDYILLSDNNQYSEPHLLINKVNYGYIDWDELELEKKRGNIGIKVQAEEVDVNPSRESIVWSDETKKMVLTRFQDVVTIATRFIEKELQETDFVKWLRICYQIASRRWSSGDGSIVARLAGIIDISQVQPVFPGDTSLRFESSDIFKGFLLRNYSLQTKTRANKKVRSVERESTWSLSSTSHLPIILMDEGTSVRRDKYLLQEVYTSGFVGIKAPEWLEELQNDPEMIITREMLRDWKLANGFNTITDKEYRQLSDVARNAVKIDHWLHESGETVLYSSIIVPESFVASNEDEEEELIEEADVAEAAVEKIDREARRKIEGKTVLHTPQYVCPQHTVQLDKFYTYAKMEVKISEIADWDQEEIFYCNDADAELMQMAAFITREPSENLSNPRARGWADAVYGIQYSCAHYFNNPRLRLVKVAQQNNKLYAGFKPIQKFFIDVKHGKLMMSNALLRWNTARLIGQKLNQAAFLWNFGTFNKAYSDKFILLAGYVKANYNEVSAYSQVGYGVTKPAYDQLIAHLNNVQQFQSLVASNPDPEDLAAVAKQMFGNPQVTDAMAVDPEVWAMYQEVLEYAEPIGSLFNQMQILTGLSISDLAYINTRFDQFTERATLSIGGELEQSIREYLEFKGVS